MESFKRVEKKYVLTKHQFENLKRELDSHMILDKYSLNGGYRIYNIYYDTSDYYLIRNSISKPFYKAKLRIRSYSFPSDEDYVFVELKRKLNKVVYKRRVKLKLKEAYDLVNNKDINKDSQVIKEIKYFCSSYNLVPKVYLRYDRYAYYLLDSDFRVTLDFNFKERMNDVKFDDTNVKTFFNDYLMEIKTSGSIPIWLKDALIDNHVYQSSFSKYGYIYKNRRNLI